MSSAAATSPWHDLPYLALLFTAFLGGLAFFQLVSTLPLYFREVYGLLEDRIGLLLALNAVMIVAFEMVLTHWVERRDKLVVVGVGWLLVCAGFGLMPFGTGLLFAASTVVVWTIGEMLSLPMLNAVVAERAPKKARGRYMGLYTMSFSVAFIVSPWLGTTVYQNLGRHTIWYAIAALGPVLLLLTLWVRRLFRAGHV